MTISLSLASAGVTAAADRFADRSVDIAQAGANLVDTPPAQGATLQSAVAPASSGQEANTDLSRAMPGLVADAAGVKANTAVLAALDEQQGAVLDILT